MSDVYTILTELGYHLTPDSDGWRTTANWRNGDNPTAVKIYNNPSGIMWYDYVENTRGTLEDLVKLTIGDKIDPKQWLAGKIDVNNLKKIEYKEKLKVPEIFPNELLNELIKDYTYFNNRQISNDVLCKLPCGLLLDSSTFLGKMKRRFVFGIQNSLGQLVGFAGRAIDKDAKVRWKLIGNKMSFCFNLYKNPHITRKMESIYLFEGLPDSLTANECNIYNNSCLFGTEMGLGLLNVLIKLNPKKIYICLNSDEPGQEAAEKLKRRLYKYFNTHQIEIKYPPTCDECKDLNDVLMQENGRNIIKDWVNKC